MAKTRVNQSDRIIPFCEIVSIPAGATPKNVVAELPGVDGARVLARWSGRPAILAGDQVKLLRRGVDGLYEVFATETAQVDPKYNIAATTDPGVGDDSADGYSEGSIWINTSTNKAFICLDPAAGAAVWQELGAGAGAFPAPGEVKIGETLYADLASAITAASPQDLILFDGTQTITGSSLAVNKAITIQGASRETAIITSTLADTVTITAAATLRDMTVKNTATSGTGSCINIQNGCVLDNVSTTTTGAATNHYGYYVSAGVNGLLIYNPGGTVTGATNNYHLYVSTASVAQAWIYQGYLYGASYDINIDAANALISLYDVQLAVGAISVTSGTLAGTARDIKGRDCGSVVKNTSGGAIAQYSVGYTDNAGEFKTTTTAQDAVAWHIATIGGPSNGYIFAKNKGNATIKYTSTAPSVGDFLVTSTTGGSAQAQTTMHPAIFAVCTAVGGGVVEALLLCDTIYIDARITNRIIRVDSASTSGFTSTISGAPSATSVVYGAVTAGNENAIVPTSSDGNIVLWNSTRSSARLITAVNTGTNTITTISSTDTWADTDTITVASTTVSGGGVNWLDIDISQISTIPILARVLWVELDKMDTGGANQTLFLHPQSAYSDAKYLLCRNPVTNQQGFLTGPVPLLNRRFAIAFGASGAGTSNNRVKLLGYFLAVP